MSHESLAEKLLELAYDELSPREAREVEAHAATCDACRSELARIRDTRRLMAGLPQEPAPEHGERVLLAAAAEAAARRRQRRRLPPWLWSGALVTASFLAVAAVSYRLVAMRGQSRSDREALLGESYAPAPPSGGAPEAPGAARAAPPTLTPAPSPEAKKAEPPRPARPSRTFAQPPPPGPVAEPAPAAPPRARAEVGPGLAEPPRARGAAASPVPAPAAPPPAAVAPSSAAADQASRPVEQEAQEGLGARRGSAQAAAKAAAAPEARFVAGEEVPPGAVRTEARTFERCEGESVRRVDVDAAGRVVRYVREGRFGGRRVRVVQTFRADGSPAAASALDLDAGGAPVDPRALGIDLAGRAEDAGLDAPPRCGR